MATFDLSAANLHLLVTDHWLSNRSNVLLLKLTQPAWHSTTAVVAAPRTDPRLVMAAWRASEVVAFAKAKDLAGPAAVVFASGMDGVFTRIFYENDEDRNKSRAVPSPEGADL